MISDNEAMLLADSAALHYHNTQVEKAFETTATFTKAQRQRNTTTRDCLIASVDFGRLKTGRNDLEHRAGLGTTVNLQDRH
jgi:hypothetical protein